MRLKTLAYSECEGTDQEWMLEGLSLGPKTLLVGKNASGKSRTLNVISGLAKHLAGLLAPTLSGKYECVFEDVGKTYIYKCQCEGKEVLSESLWIEGKLCLDRKKGGVGEIWADEIDNGSYIRFQTPITEFAAVARRDSIQHSFLEALYNWASTLRYFQFGTNLGKDRLAIFHPNGAKVDERDQEAIVGIFRDAKEKFGDKFINALLRDLSIIGYDIEIVDIGPPISVRVPDFPGNLVGLYVKEKDLPGITDQFSISQGMYRVLTLLIHVNYLQLKNTPTCLLVDDIGEGLDFDRSCRLIGLLRLKAAHSDMQIILSTNDRFVMNEVPLDEWSILQRKGNHISIRNNENSRAIFEDFKFTGLSNFSFLELDIINEQPIDERNL